MKVLVLGGDGYLGWPTAMHFAKRGDDVLVVDNYLRRLMAVETDSQPLFEVPTLDRRVEKFKELSGKNIEFRIGDLSDYGYCNEVVASFNPDVVVHYAEQPSAPYSMMDRINAQKTLHNNLGTTFNIIWAVLENNPNIHIIKLGTMGEYGTPNIDIEEGWIDIEHNGRKDKFLFPRAAGSLYHTTKVLDTDMLWFYVRTYNLRVTDLMQGPVYGLVTDENEGLQELMPAFHYDDIFGTVVNRFLVQAISGIPLTVYGNGGQTRGYLNLNNTLECVALAADNPANLGELRILNQFTEQFTVNELADRVKTAAAEIGVSVKINSIDNPRKEKEEHYYNAKHSGLLDLGLKPRFMTTESLVAMLEKVKESEARIDKSKIMPRVKWS